MSLCRFVVAASLVFIGTAAAPAKASADWLFTPYIGGTFGGSADVSIVGESFEDEFDRKMAFGGSLEWMGAGVFGFGVDFGYAPNFFKTSLDDDSFGDSNVTTLMANVIIGAPMGPVRPYASGGVGLMQQKVEDAGQFFGEIDNTDFGYNAGAGVMGFFTDNIGIRGDIRYFRSVHDVDPDGIDLELGSLRFWRGTVGVTFKF